MRNTIVFRKNTNMVSRKIEDETILLPIYKTSEEINCIYTLNKVGSEVWDLIDGKRTVAGMKKIVSEKFDAADEEIDKEMAHFLKDLKEIKAIV